MKAAFYATAVVLSFSAFAATAAGGARADERREFLKGLGFEDHVAITREYQRQKLYYNEMNRRQQDRNLKTYETVNASRELAILIFEGLDARLENGPDRAALVEFTAKMLALQPLPPPLDYPKSVMSRPAGEERSAALNDWLIGQRRQQMETHSRQVVADIAGLLHGDDLQGRERELGRLYHLVSTIIDRVYLDTQVGETRFFGRALAALIARQDQTSPRSGLRSALAQEVRRYDLHLENFLGDQWIIDSSSGPRRVPVENGTMLSTRNLAVESLQIAFAALPANRGDRWRAKARGLVGQLRSMPFFVTPEDAAEGMSMAKQIKDKIQQLDLPMNWGLSHIGYVLVKRDRKTGIKMSWTVDNYPQTTADSSQILANPGGVRLAGLEQMLDPSHHSKIAIGRIDHEKFHAWAQESRREIGYPKDGAVFDSFAVGLQEGHAVAPNEPKSDPWMIHLTPQEYEKLHDQKNPEAWYRDVSENFVNKGLMDMLYRGVNFQWVTAGMYFKGGAYCSSTGFIAWLQSTGLSIERLFRSGEGARYRAELARQQLEKPGFRPTDGWSWHVRLLNNLGQLAERMQGKNILPKVAERILGNNAVRQAMLFTQMDIVAPSGLMAQAHVKTEIVDLADRRIDERLRLPYRDYREKNAKLLSDVERLLPRENEAFRRHLSRRMDPSDTSGAAMRDVEYRMAVMGMRQKKTKGLDPADMAVLGAERSMVKVLHEWERRGTPDNLDLVESSAVRCEAVLAH
ncbi:MAG: hypothetical protein KF865_13465 [Bdellovibrionaceae bacterium]|nr:hypothetical protein [Pseudobdellovibrionaceae bacterium]